MTQGLYFKTDFPVLQVFLRHISYGERVFRSFRLDSGVPVRRWFYGDAYTEAVFEDECYLLFGKETKGLPEELLLENPETSVRVPMVENARSLNLSNTVAIAAYEILRQWDFPELQNLGQLHNYRWDDW